VGARVQSNVPDASGGTDQVASRNRRGREEELTGKVDYDSSFLDKPGRGMPPEEDGGEEFVGRAAVSGVAKVLRTSHVRDLRGQKYMRTGTEPYYKHCHHLRNS